MRVISPERIEHDYVTSCVAAMAHTSVAMTVTSRLDNRENKTELSHAGSG